MCAVVVVKLVENARRGDGCTPSDVGQRVNEPVKKHGRTKATVRATEEVPWASSRTG